MYAIRSYYDSGLLSGEIDFLGAIQKTKERDEFLFSGLCLPAQSPVSEKLLTPEEQGFV